jgi:peptidyl-prolyl cis-trans isomerase D
MLQTLRDKTSGWIATVVLGLLIIPFAFVGVNQYLTGGNDNTVARVQAPPGWWASAPLWWPVSQLWQSEDVSPNEFREAFDRARAQQREADGDNFDSRAFESADNKRKVLDQLIDQKVMLLAARRAGITISDAALHNSIAQIPAFQVDGKFDLATYTALLASQASPMSSLQFEQRERDRLRMGVLPLGIADSDFSTGVEVDRLIKLLGETRDITLVLMPAPVPDTAEVGDAEIKTWYESHSSNFKQPETVTLEYVEVDGSQMPVAEADEAMLRKRYEQEKNRFVTPEQRLVSHILVAVPANADAAAQKAAEEKARSLAAQARQPGADFAALAKANSEDTGSKDSGGDLGWIEQNGAMVKPFEDAVFAGQAGGIGDPVKTEFGWHVIQVREIKGGQGKGFEEVRAELTREEADSGREHAYNQVASQLTDEAMKNPTALAAAADTVGLPVRTVGPFARGNAPGIFANPAVLRVAFSEQTIEDGTISDPIEIAPMHSVLIRATAHVPEQVRPLDQVRDAVIAAIRAERASKAAAQAADALLARLQKGEALHDIAAADKLEVHDIPGLRRSQPVPTYEGNDAVFAAPRPAEGKVSAGKSKLPGSRFAVFTVDKVTDGDVSMFTAPQREQLKQQLQQIRAASSSQSFIEATRKQFRLTVHEDRL